MNFGVREAKLRCGLCGRWCAGKGHLKGQRTESSQTKSESSRLHIFGPEWDHLLFPYAGTRVEISWAKQRPVTLMRGG